MNKIEENKSEKDKKETERKIRKQGNFIYVQSKKVKKNVCVQHKCRF